MAKIPNPRGNGKAKAARKGKRRVQAHSKSRQRKSGEKWRWVVGFEGLYEVSNLGRVRSWRRACPKILGPIGTRYPSVEFCGGNGHSKRINIHRVVLLAFSGEPPSKNYQSRHLNGNPQDNRLANLKWGTGKENAADRRRHGNDAIGSRNGMWRRGLHGEDGPNAKLTWQKVGQIRRLSRTMSHRALGRKFGVHNGTIGRIVLQKTWHPARRAALGTETQEK